MSVSILSMVKVGSEVSVAWKRPVAECRQTRLFRIIDMPQNHRLGDSLFIGKRLSPGHPQAEENIYFTI